MIVVWILLGVIGYFGPIILMFYSSLVELKERRTVVTVGDVWKNVDDFLMLCTLVPIVSVFFGIYYAFRILFFKTKNIEL